MAILSKFSQFLHWIAVWRKNLGALADIRGPGRQQVEAIARDLGLGLTAPIFRIANVEFNLLGTRPELLRKVEVLCRTCNKYNYCEQDFERHRSKTTKFAAYCPNARQFEHLLGVEIR